MNDLVRRPIAARKTHWAASITRQLVHSGLKPNHVSILSIIMSAAAGACLLAAHDSTILVRTLLLVAAAVCIQLRLLCNLFDGMMAVEAGLKTSTGELFNDFPDRISDPLVLVAAGYFASPLPFAIELGWTAALLSVLVAYVRVLGASAGAPHQFCGPMAKQQRMAILTIACLLTTLEPLLHWHGHIIFASLVIIIIGCVLTAGFRFRRIAITLRAES